MLKDLEAVIGYKFRNISLLQNALTHSSYANERWHNGLLSNERLEFLGDSVLGMLVAEAQGRGRCLVSWPLTLVNRPAYLPKRRCLSITKTTMPRSLGCLPDSNITDYNFTRHSAYSFHAVASISGKVLDEPIIVLTNTTRNIFKYLDMIV